MRVVTATSAKLSAVFCFAIAALGKATFHIEDIRIEDEGVHRMQITWEGEVNFWVSFMRTTFMGKPLVATTGTALPDNSDAFAAYHYKWRSVYFELSQTQ